MTEPIHVRFDDETMRAMRAINRKNARNAWLVITLMLVIAAASLYGFHLWLVTQ